MSRDDAKALVRWLGARRAADRISALGTALGLALPADATVAAQLIADRWAAGTAAERWLVLAVLTSRLPSSEQVVEASRFAALESPQAALIRAVRSSGRPRGTHSVRVVSNEPVVVGSLPDAAAWHRGALVLRDEVIVPWRAPVILLEIPTAATSAAGALARFSESTMVGVSDGLSALTDPARAPALASHLDALSWSHIVLVESDGAAEELRAWRSMLGGLGRPGPTAEVLPADRRPATASGWTEWLRLRSQS